jgi:hypothetical protein
MSPPDAVWRGFAPIKGSWRRGLAQPRTNWDAGPSRTVEFSSGSGAMRLAATFVPSPGHRSRTGPGRAGAAPRRAGAAPRWSRVAVNPAGHNSRKRKNPGDDLCSRKAALSVSSALESLTSVFGMGTGVASPLESPGKSAAWTMSFGSSRVFDFARVHFVARHARGGSQWSQPLILDQLLKRSSPRPLVRLSFIRHRTSTCRLSNRWSPCGLTWLTQWGTSSRGELRT